MGECKAIISVDICDDGSLNEIAQRVAKGMSLNKACKQVAEEFNAKHAGATVKSDTLRKAYQRNQKVGTCPNSATKRKVGTCPNFLEEEKVAACTQPNSPTSFVTTDLFVTVDKYNTTITKLNERIRELEDMVNEQALREAERFLNPPAPAKPKVDSNNTTITRATAFSFVKAHGNEFQNIALKSDDLDNDRLFRLFIAVRNAYLERNPPFSLPKEILNATGIRDDI